MMKSISIEQLVHAGMSQEDAASFLSNINNTITTQLDDADIAWHAISKQLTARHYHFDIHLSLFKTLFPNWPHEPDSAPAWMPSDDQIQHANITKLMRLFNTSSVHDLHQFSVNHTELFWQTMISTIGIPFKHAPSAIIKNKSQLEHPEWLPDAQMNIADACFKADPNKCAIRYQASDLSIHDLSYHALLRLTNQIANSLILCGFKKGDAIAIAMPMNQYAIAIYLGIIKMGGIVISIADSFSAEEMRVRLKIANAKAIFTQDTLGWLSKEIPLYEKVKTAANQLSTKTTIITTSRTNHLSVELRSSDISWTDFLCDNDTFDSVTMSPMDPCNILFSSGTTGDPKAIVWNHTTAIKAASDAFLHQDIQQSDILAWPTNLGWMMGPWLIFASLINQATMALAYGAPKDETFGKFTQDSHVTMLGVVPTLVATWRDSKCMESLDWHRIKAFSSTGECSNPEDMLYLMSLAGYKPVIEYCGGTEIGGAYITSTMVENNFPSVFTTPAMGMNLQIIHTNDDPSIGEVAISPPSIGLSTTLLNADHSKVYFHDMPEMNGVRLRRHGDQIKKTKHGFYTLLGRVDDTMKLGGIKISSAEIERVISSIDHIIEVAAIAVQPLTSGPNRLVIYATTHAILDKKDVMAAMQRRINQELNPLFKIHDLIFKSELPKTASNKIMRRILRDEYIKSQQT